MSVRSRGNRGSDASSNRYASAARSVASDKASRKQRSKSTLSFYHQREIDDFNQLRRGYKSPMPGFEEDFFAEMLKAQYQLELELERFK